MPSLQIRDIPEDLYDALAERARRQRRSMAQQAIADLRTIEELDARRRREAAVERLRRGKPLSRKLTDPVRLIREDRSR